MASVRECMQVCSGSLRTLRVHEVEKEINYFVRYADDSDDELDDAAELEDDLELEDFELEEEEEEDDEVYEDEAELEHEEQASMAADQEAEDEGDYGDGTEDDERR